MSYCSLCSSSAVHVTVNSQYLKLNHSKELNYFSTTFFFYEDDKIIGIYTCMAQKQGRIFE